VLELKAAIWDNCVGGLTARNNNAINFTFVNERNASISKSFQLHLQTERIIKTI
jgi:hypothetical protein